MHTGPLRDRFAIMPSMALTRDEVHHIAQLARLRLTADEEARYQVQLSAILDYAARLRAVDTSTIPPMSSVLPLDAPLRPDVPRTSSAAPQLLANAPQAVEGMFRVPPVFE
jgi:aspartyl-tRNA(Asn)/glutamyl-tRNA(Gln) amidotransferase subunit C